MLGDKRKSRFDPCLAQKINDEYSRNEKNKPFNKDSDPRSGMVGQMMDNLELQNNNDLIRTFHPIGQGAFYSERHFVNGREFNFVYDCESTSFNIEKLEKKVNSTFPPNHIIDILFISHFHTDHINGLNALKNRYHIKKVILPYCDEEARILVKINNFINDNNLDTSLIDDPIDFFRQTGKETSVIFIDPVEPREGVNLEETSDISTFIPPEGKRIPSGKVFVSNLKDYQWYFIPFNYKQIERRNLFVKVLSDLGLTLNDIDTVERIVFNIKKIKKAYQAVEGDLNMNSMILFSGNNLKDCIFSSTFKRSNNPYFSLKLNSSCIYLGDIDLNEKGVIDDIESKLEILLPNVGTIQIPHHGSVHNFKNSIIYKNVGAAIISYGKENKYGHPSDSVIGEITKNGADTYFVTRNQHSIVVQTRETLL